MKEENFRQGPSETRPYRQAFGKRIVFMSEKQTPINHRIEDNGAGAAVLQKVLNTREVRQFLAAVLPGVLTVYAGKSRFRKVVSRMAGRHLSKNLSPAKDAGESPAMETLFEDETVVREAARVLPELANAFLGVADAAAATVEGLEADEKKALFENLVSAMVRGESGVLITRGCRIVNDIHARDSEFFTRVLAPGFRKWVESVDFGELKEAVDNSSADVRAFAVMANDVLWEYPSKVLLLLSLLPSAVNRIAESADISLNRLNELPADLLTDVVLSLIREIDAGPVAGMVNELAEVARKVHTGSALLGEPGAPQLPGVLAGKIEAVVAAIDPVVLWKARLAMAETGAAIEMAMTDAVNDRPDLKRLSMVKRPEITNARVKRLNHAMSWWDGQDDEAVAEAVAGSFSAYDVQSLAEAVNNALRVFNRTGDQRPEFIPQLVDRFVSAIDDDELAWAAEKLLGAGDEAVHPAARAVVPRMVQWVAGVLAPADDAYEDDAQQAREALQHLFAREEV